MKIPYERAEVEISKDMIEVVIAEFEAANPGKSAYDMAPSEFADRMMAKVKITVTASDDAGSQ